MIQASTKALLLSLGFLVVSIFYYWLHWSSAIPVLGGDHAAYLLMADHFSPWGGRDAEVILSALDFIYFPPLYPLILGILGATSSHLELAHAVTITFLIMAMFMYFLLAYGLTQSRLQSFALVSIFALMPTTFLQSFGILSEPLYLFLSLVVLWLLQPADIPTSRLYAAAFVIGLATITRTAGIALVISFAIYLLLHARKQWLHLVLLSLIPLLGWNITKWLLDYPGSYIWIMESILEKKTLSYVLLDKPINELHGLWVGWITSIDHTPVLGAMIIGSILVAICLAGALHRVWTKEYDGWYIIIYLGILVVWPSTPDARRFLFVVVPIMLAQGFLFLSWAARRLIPAWPAIVRYAYLFVLALMIFPPTSLLFNRLSMAVEASNWEAARSIYWYQGENVKSVLEHNRLQIEAKDRFAHSWRKIPEFVDKHECVYSVDPLWVMLYSDRPSTLTPLVNTREQFFQKATRCRYVYIAHYIHPPYLMFYPKDYLDEGKIVFVDHIEHAGHLTVLGMLVEMPSQEAPKEGENRNEAGRHPS